MLVEQPAPLAWVLGRGMPIAPITIRIPRFQERIEVLPADIAEANIKRAGQAIPQRRIDIGRQIPRRRQPPELFIGNVSPLPSEPNRQPFSQPLHFHEAHGVQQPLVLMEHRVRS